ncbi:hypothetical protein COLO4_25173 [Corchorus olitorius]|uniref:TF-B3 domain-containing protein n=1 Tax=Corchorus olitorius TaxID=93759 RepID=A0A1R3I4G0_9ROSI|nr:hypothetical protein COLO4_25173 [Corchorus olitorius]
MAPKGRSNGHSPHFFKVVLADALREGKLEIPKKFAGLYGNTLSNRVILKVPTGAEWEVKLTKSNGKIWLQRGWKEFADQYSVEPGHFLVFRYDGSSHFDVIIFDKSASEIQYEPYASDNEEETEQQEENYIEDSDDDSDDSVMIIDDISIGRQEKPQSKCGRPPNNRMKTKRRELSPSEESKLLQRAGFSSKNPYFTIVLTPAYISNYLLIPTVFARRHLKKQGDIALKSKGKTWSASCFIAYQGINRLPYVRLHWRKFVRDNKLTAGDICAFELINRAEITFKVFINRGKEVEFEGTRASSDVSCPVRKEAGTSSAHQGSTLQTPPFRPYPNPICLVTLPPSHAHKYYLNLPEEFARTCFPKTFMNSVADVTLRMNGKAWPAECRQQRIFYGWKAFVQDNNLQAGDNCVLEMVKETSRIFFNVFIFKDFEDMGGHTSPGFTMEPITLASQSHTAPKKQPHKAASSKQTSKRLVFEGTEGASRLKKKDLGFDDNDLPQKSKRRL